MRNVKMLSVYLITILFLGMNCSNSTEPEESDLALVLQSMDTINQQVGDLTDSQGYSTFAQVPEVDPDNQESVADTTEDPISSYFYLFFDKGTYSYDGENLDFSDTQQDSINFIFPYKDEETGLTYTAMWSYHDIVTLNSDLSVDFDVTVADVQFIGINIHLTGTGFADMTWDDKPDVESMTVSGFMRDKNGVRSDLSLSMTESRIDLILVTEGEDSLILSMTGEFSLNTDAVQKYASLVKNSHWDASQDDAAIKVTKGPYYFYYDPALAPTGEMGYIQYAGGPHLATIKLINSVATVVFADGNQRTIQEALSWIDFVLMPFNPGGEFI